MPHATNTLETKYCNSCTPLLQLMKPGTLQSSATREATAMRNPRTTTQCSAYSWQLEKAPVLCVQLLSHVPLLQPQGHQPIRLPCPWDFPGKKARVGCHFLFQGIFLTQGSNWRLLHWQAGSLPLNHLGIPRETPYTATKTQCSQKNK